MGSRLDSDGDHSDCRPSGEERVSVPEPYLRAFVARN